MKKALISFGIVTLLASLCSAQTIRIGAHGAYASGDGLWQSASGAGLQLEFLPSNFIGAEISGTSFSDKEADGHREWDNIIISGTLKLGINMRGALGAYAGIGMDYLSVSTKHDISVCGETDIIDYSVDPAFGGHVSIGAMLNIAEHVSFFAEYRATSFTEVSDTYTFDDGYEEVATENYDFSLVLVGANFVF